jgi:hypothetical protein
MGIVNKMLSDSKARIAAHRQFFAELVTANVPSPQVALVEAFRTTPREAFLGPGPWYAFTGNRSVSIPTDDPSFVYQDVVIRLKGDVNNGRVTTRPSSRSSSDRTAVCTPTSWIMSWPRARRRIWRRFRK